MNKKGFSLAELIGVIVIVSIIIILTTVAFIGIRRTILEKQYSNLITYLSTKAASFAEETGELNVTVERLIETGFVEPEKDNVIRDPRNNNSINCYLFDSKYENGNYNATFTKDIGLSDDSGCNKYEIKKEMQICVMEGNVCNTEIASWYNKNVVLSVLIGGNQELVNNASVTWKVDGVITNGPTYETNISRINKGLYTADVKYEELRADGTTKLIEGVEIVAINIDLEKPNVKSIDINKEHQWTNSNKKVTIKMTDNNGSGLDAIAIVDEHDSCNNIVNSWMIVVDDTYTIELDNGIYNICLKDNAGNITSGNVSNNGLFEISKIDKIVPTCEINTNLSPDGENGWYTSKPINISLITSDNNPGNIARGLRRDNEEAYYNNVSTISHSDDANNATYYGFVKDEAGNEGVCSKEISLDTINPKCNIVVSGEKTIVGSEWYTSDVIISLEETKGTSNIVGHNLTTSATVSYKNTALEAITQSNTTGINYYGYVKGASGREGSCEKLNIRVDTIKPAINNIVIEGNNSGTSTIKATLSDSGSKLMAYAVTINGNPPSNWVSIANSPETYNLNYSTTDNGTHYIWVKDNAGNIKSTSSNVTIAYNQTTKVRYENADGTWGNWQIVETKLVNSGESYSWSTSKISNFDNSIYQTTSVDSYIVTGEKTNEVSIYRNKYTCTISYKLQNADGTYANIQTGKDTTLRYGETCSWSRSADATYKAASYSTTITGNISQTISVDRNTFTITKRYRLQGTDETYPSTYTSDGTQTVRYGDSYTYSKSATTSHQAVSESLSNVTNNQTISLDVPRKTFTVTKQYKLQDATGNYPSTYTSGGTQTVVYGGSYTYSIAATTSHQAASGSVSNVTSDKTISVNVPRKTFTVTKQYKLQDTSGNYPSTYTSGGTQTVVYGGSYTYSIAATTSHQAASGSVSNVTSNQTISVNVPRKTFTITKQYKLQNSTGVYPSTYTSGGTQTVVYGGSYTYSIAATTSHQAASGSVSNVTSNQTISVNVPRKTFTVTKQYKLQDTTGNYPSSYTSEGTQTVVYGGSYTYSIAATTSHKAASGSVSNVTSNQTISVNVPRKTFTCSKQYRLQNVDGTWGNYVSDGSVTAYYDGSCSYSKKINNYRQGYSDNNTTATTQFSNVTENKTLSLDMYRNTFNCNKQYRLENVDGTWGEYTPSGNEYALYGGSCSFTYSQTYYRNGPNAANNTAATVTKTNVTSEQTLSISMYRNLYTCTKQYRLENGDGTWGDYIVESVETLRYQSSCRYEREDIPYYLRHGYVFTSSLDYDDILHFDYKRETFSLTISSDYYTTSSPESGVFRWGEKVAITATPNTNAVFTKWIQTDGTSSTFGNANSAKTTFEMPKSDATIKSTGRSR